ncbi:AMP-dependent synthetase/ligase [Boudabousia tangfeifanii]|uniref:AMP-dependent synthetase/ligase n=1 Tax=Boudabousia tangfeifanii TaxID=1912795 RepID=UPI001478ADE3|nr:AMP-dependent synthetase/ligase [Boudabousia tangfeifanii]
MISFLNKKSKINPVVPPVDTLGELFSARLKRTPKATAVYKKDPVGGEWLPLTVSEVSAQLDAVSRGLLGLGYKKGDAIAILGATSLEWMLLDVAAVSIGLISVPIYESDSPAQIRHILTDAQIQMVVTQTVGQAALVKTQLEALGTEKTPVWDFEDGALAKISQAGSTISDKELKAAKNAVKGEDLATIVYTSGTTSTPKGVELTHYNFAKTIYDIQFIAPKLLLDPEATMFLFLPTAHVLARYVQFAILASAPALAHGPNIKNLVSDMQSLNPTSIMVVPRVLEKIRLAARNQAPSGVKKRLFNWCEKQSIAYSKALEEDGRPPLALRRKHALAAKLVLSKIKSQFGSGIDLVVCGGAPLNAELGHFFRGIGLDLIEGYGMTETTGPATVNRPGKAIMGTVGTLLQGTEVKFTEQGEILLRGSQIMRGYHNLPEETAKALDEDGWLHTGDLGHMGPEGHVIITGRAKDVIVTAGGKNVAPIPLEDELRSHPLISQAVVLGDQKPFISALIVLNQEALPNWFRNHNLPFVDITAALAEPKLKASLQKAVDRANKLVSRAESIREFRILPGDFTEANGLLTPSLKVKRAAVIARYQDLVDDIYQGKKRK